jgi:predicted RNA-binding Zn-ribbon protein involved in translation (DUF1610 family)
MDNLLQQGIAAYKAGKRDEARNFFIAFTKQSPDDERAWEWMSKVTNNEQERNYCIQQISRINPKSAALNMPNTQQSSFTQLPSQNIKSVSLVTLTCPSCGGKLQITNDIERFSCGHCGNEHMVRRNGNAISLAPVIEGLKGVKVGVDKTVSELAIKRLSEEIDNLEKEISEINSRPYTRHLLEQQKLKQNAGQYRFGCVLFAFVGFIILSVGPAMHKDIAFMSYLCGAGFIVLGIFIFTQTMKTIPATPLTPSESEKLEKLQILLNKKKADSEQHRGIIDS